MAISPYGDVAQVSGEMVEWLRNYPSLREAVFRDVAIANYRLRLQRQKTSSQ